MKKQKHFFFRPSEYTQEIFHLGQTMQAFKTYNVSFKRNGWVIARLWNNDGERKSVIITRIGVKFIF